MPNLEAVPIENMAELRATIQRSIDLFNRGFDNCDSRTYVRAHNYLEGMQAVLKAFGITLECDQDGYGNMYYKLS